MKIRKENVLGHAVHKINYFEKNLGYPLNQFTKKIKIFQFAKCSDSCGVGGALVFFIRFASI